MIAAVALARRELVRFFRQPSRIVGAIAPPILAWVLVGSGFRASFTSGDGSTAFGYFFPGTIVLVVLFASIFSTISVIEDRREGFLQGVLVSPVSPFALVLGKLAGATLLAMLQGGLLLLLIPALGLPLSLATFLPAVGILFLLSFALTGLGFAIAWSLESTQGFHAVMNLFLLPMWLLSGAFFPASGAPSWLRLAMAVNPLTYGVSALRTALAPGSTQAALGPAALVTLAFAVAMFLTSSFVVARNPAGPGPK